jgi:hypothetical protein
MGATYGLVKVENALLVTLAGVFVYLWARRLVARPYAIVALALTLLLPALNLSMTVMTENAVYPCFALALFAIALALERPTLIRQGLVLLALALVVLARVQELVLVPAVVLAVAIKLTLDRRAGASSRGETRRQLRLAGVLLIGGLAYALVRMGEGRSLTGSLGGYQGVLHGTYSFTDVVQWTLWQAGELVIAVAFIPVAAFILVVVKFARDRSTAPAERAFVATSVPAAILLVGEVGAFGAGGFSGPWIIERYTFYAAPIFFLGFAIWLGRGLPRPSALTALALAAPAALLLSLPLEDKVGPTLSANILTLAALRRLSEQLSGGLDEIRLLLALAVVVGAVLFVAVPRRYARVVLPLAVCVALLVLSRALYQVMRIEALDLKRYAAGPDPTWIDRATGGVRADFLYAPVPNDKDSSKVLLEQEFWNRRLKRAYELGGLPVTTLPQSLVSLDARTGQLDPAPRARYLVVPASLAVDGKLVATQLGLAAPLAVYRTRSPSRLAHSVEGLYPDGWMGGSAAYVQWAGSRRGHMQVMLSRIAWPGPDVPGHAVVRVGPIAVKNGATTIKEVTATKSWTIHAGGSRTLSLPTPRAPFRLEITISPTFSPSQFGQGDPRQLGAQLQFAPG